MSKSDRLTKAVEKVAEFDHRLGWHVSRGDADRLVRSQFDAIRRMVRRQQTDCEQSIERCKKYEINPDFLIGARDGYVRVLAALDQWRRG